MSSLGFSNCWLHKTSKDIPFTMSKTEKRRKKSSHFPRKTAHNSAPNLNNLSTKMDITLCGPN